MLHVMSETYGLLPSEFLARADTFDMMVFDVANTVKEHQNADDKEKGKMYDPAEMESYFKQVTGR